MKGQFVGKFSGFAIMLCAGVAAAGTTDTKPVTLFTDGGLPAAQGCLRSARDSADNVQGIGCLRSTNVLGPGNVFCFATNANGTSRSCNTTNPASPNMALAVGLANPAAYVRFRVAADGVTCSRITVMSDSTCL